MKAFSIQSYIDRIGKTIMEEVMNIGKLSNSILKRSVLKLIKKNKNIVSGAAVGADAAIVEYMNDSGEKQGRIAASVSSAQYGVYRVYNNMEASGAHIAGVVANIMLPSEADEAELKNCVRTIGEQCESLNIPYAGGDTRVLTGITTPVISITGFGNVYAGETASKGFIGAKNAKAGQDVILTKWIGIEGIRLITEKKQEEILEKYTKDLLDRAVGSRQDLLIVPEAQLAIANGVTSLMDVSEGGIFAALWDFAESSGVGLDIDIRKIPVKQEMIEICEIFDVNPYELSSTGCLLMTYERGCDIVNLLSQNGISATIIGTTTDSNDKIIRHDEEIRYLDPPKRDEIYKF